jgi:hypothetical protein
MRNDTAMNVFFSYFFIKLLTLVPIGMPRSNFDFCQIFPWLFVFEISKNGLPAVNESGE